MTFKIAAFVLVALALGGCLAPTSDVADDQASADEKTGTSESAFASRAIYEAIQAGKAGGGGWTCPPKGSDLEGPPGCEKDPELEGLPSKPATPTTPKTP